MIGKLLRPFIIPFFASAMLLAHPCFAGAGTCQTGAGLFDYGPHRENVEAEHLAMTLTGALRAPDEEYDRILRDLQLIRIAYPFLAPEIAAPDHSLNQLVVTLDPGLPSSAYDALNVFYQIVDDSILVGDTHILTYCDNINADALEPEYEALAEVTNASPNVGCCFQNTTTVSVLADTYRYDIYNGFEDCTNGCLCSRTWLIDVASDETITLINYAENGNLSVCTFEDVACCQETVACSAMDMTSCLSAPGRPMAIGVACSFCAPSIPAVSEWGIAISALLLIVAGTIVSARLSRA